MIKSSLYVLVYFTSFIITPIFAQKRYVLEKGEISFTSNADLEVIKANSKSVKGILDTLSKQFAFSIPIRTFEGFNSALQQEHFNENYLESDKYPTAAFSGKIIEHIDYSKTGNYEIRAKGELDIHGQKQIRIIKIKMQVKNGILDLNATFKVPLDDHNITIPNIVSQKIATEIDVNFKGTMKSQK